MENCCDTNKNISTTHIDKLKCPVNHQLYKRVSPRTVMHHISRPWQQSFEGKNYYFCEDPNCDVVYFDDTGTTITRADVRTIVGVKTREYSAPVCYCFGVSKQDYLHSPSIKDFVIKQTKLKNCSCETKNPSGRCCLKDFSKLELKTVYKLL